MGVTLVLPETPANQEVGMFQVYAELSTARGDVLVNRKPLTLGPQLLQFKLLTTFNFES